MNMINTYPVQHCVIRDDIGSLVDAASIIQGPKTAVNTALTSKLGILPYLSDIIPATGENRQWDKPNEIEFIKNACGTGGSTNLS